LPSQFVKKSFGFHMDSTGGKNSFEKLDILKVYIIIIMPFKTF
jgi:hypothetical protein